MPVLLGLLLRRDLPLVRHVVAPGHDHDLHLEALVHVVHGHRGLDERPVAHALLLLLVELGPLLAHDVGPRAEREAQAHGALLTGTHGLRHVHRLDLLVPPMEGGCDCMKLRMTIRRYSQAPTPAVWIDLPKPLEISFTGMPLLMRV